MNHPPGHRKLFLIVLWLGLACELATSAPALSLNARRVHLGQRDRPEWDWFVDQAPDGGRFDLSFVTETNRTECTLFIRQDDVKQEWVIELNRKRLGRLFLMEADLVHALPIPPGMLRDGTNLLSILPGKEVDDILLHDIRLDRRPLRDALGESSLSLEVTDGAGGGFVPCRLTLIDQRGVLAPWIARETTPAIAVRPGVVYTGNGRAHLGLPPGDYTVFASRGFEWSVATQQVHVASAAHARVALQLRREVDTAGLVSCDTHVHTFTHSGHGDATVEERMLTLAGEGIELPIATDHNLHIDYSETAVRMGVARDFTPVTGNEVTTPAGHFNIFPVDREARVPDFRITHWPTLMRALRATPGVRVVILNHPRNIHSGFQPFAATNYNGVTGENLRGPEFTVDAMELLNSSAQQTDYLLVYRDWFALLNHGYRIAGVGSSDGHDVSRYIIGQGRTYLRCPDQEPGRLDVATACSNLLSGRALVSMGLLVTLSVEENFGVGDLAVRLPPEVKVKTRVQGPSWVTATNVVLFANGVRVWEKNIDSSKPSLDGTKADFSWRMPRPTHDVHLVALATGPGIIAPFWATPRPYQPTSTHWQNRVIASTNPIYLDADADGAFTSARGYAQKTIGQYGVEPAKLLGALNRFDEAVAAQAAQLCATAGVDLNALSFRAALAAATPAVRRGFAAFAETQVK